MYPITNVLMIAMTLQVMDLANDLLLLTIMDALGILIEYPG
jgi:hypothetical protein